MSLKHCLGLYRSVVIIVQVLYAVYFIETHLIRKVPKQAISYSKLILTLM